MLNNTKKKDFRDFEKEVITATTTDKTDHDETMSPCTTYNNLMEHLSCVKINKFFQTLNRSDYCIKVRTAK